MSDDGQPLVSCIMPTYNRRQFVGQAIWYFLRQDYPHRELVVVDDGDDPVGDLVPDDARIRYVRLDDRRSVGAKRNLACQLSHGDLICHWDDDDWMAPHRLRLQVDALTRSKADICGTRELLHYRPQIGDAWLYRSQPDDGTYLVGPTLLFRRACWDAHPFEDRQVGEDTAFVRHFQVDRVHTMADYRFYVAVIHDRNTATKNLDDPRWQQRPLDEVGRLLILDRDFYAQLRNGGRVGLRPHPAAPTVTVVASFMVYDGYGSMSEYLVLGMQRAGARVDVVPLSFDPTGLSPELLTLVDRSRPEPGAPTLFVSWLSGEFQRFASARELFVNTMWESSRLPAGWTEALNRARAIIVPTRFVARVCRDSGVTVPVEVVPEGVDPQVYHYQERPQRDGVTTLMVATVVGRKHVHEGVAAWKRAFRGEPEARLIIKARFNYRNYRPDDTRIRFVDQQDTTRGIAHWYREADVLMALGNEGFGLPLIEGMATGLPVVALASEGQADVCEDARELVLPTQPVRWEPCNDPPFGPAGVRGVPGVEQTAAQLRWVADHREEARELGRAASRWVLAKRNVWHKGPAVLEVMEQHLRPRRPLRRVHTLWTPQWEGACGVAEYTSHLIQEAGAANATGSTPDMRAVRLLHVQHEPSLFQDAELSLVAQQAQAAGVPIAVTEHSVTSVARAWEREVDALVALTTRGAEQLRQTWPSQQVEHIPHGCPTWFPPRKRQRGSVIGAFGFLEPHKGFWRLLDILRELEGTELLLYSHSKKRAMTERWEKDADGLPVRWENTYLPIEDVARRLAAEADILVYWYDKPTVVAASGAVRVGLATGVPVLTSPTGWFEDVRDVTYQPLDLVDGVQHLLEDTALRNQLTAAAKAFCQEHSWARIANRHLALWQSLENGT